MAILNKGARLDLRVLGGEMVAFLTFFLFIAAPVLSQSGELPGIPRLALENFSPASRQAIEGVYTLLRRKPDDARLNGELGMLLHAYEQFALAEICYRRAHLLDSASFEWLYYLATVEGLQGKREESLGNLRGALERKPGYVPGKLKLAEALFNADRSPESIAAYQEILKENPESALAHYGLGRALAADHQLKEAADHLLKACTLFQGFGSAHYFLGLVYRDLRKPEKAKEQLALFQKNQNNWPPENDSVLSLVKQLRTGAREQLAFAVKLARANRLEEAVREHEKALEMDSQLVQAHVHLISLYGQLNQPDKADLHYRKAAELNPNLAESHYNFGVLMSSQGQSEEAAKAFERALEINPHYADAHNNLGYALEIQGKLENAARHYQEALKNDPTHRQARFNLGRALVASGKSREAVEHFSKILTPEDENTPRYMYALASAYVRSGELKKALDYSENAKQRAVRLGQTELAEQIERDLQKLRKAVGPR